MYMYYHYNTYYTYFTVFVYFCRYKLEHTKVVSHEGGQQKGEWLYSCTVKSILVQWHFVFLAVEFACA